MRDEQSLPFPLFIYNLLLILLRSLLDFDSPVKNVVLLGEDETSSILSLNRNKSKTFGDFREAISQQNEFYDWSPLLEVVEDVSFCGVEG